MEINILYVYGLIVALALIIEFVLFKKKKNTISKILVILIFGVLGLGLFTLTVFSSKYNIDKYKDENHYYLGADVDKDGNFKYLDSKTFTFKTTKVDLSKAVIAKNISQIGFNNKYQKYIELGNIRLTWDVKQDTVILSKFHAIQLGLYEAKGDPDEQEFKIATSSEVLEQLEKNEK